MSFDFSSATEYQRKELHKIAHNGSTHPDSEERVLSEFLFPRQILWFFLTLDGKRDICEIGSYPYPKDRFDVDERPKEILESLPITYQEEKSITSYDEEKEDTITPWWQICSDGRNIDAEIDDDMSSEDWGRFYGYPEWAIQAFVDDRNVISEEVAAELEFSLDELKYLELLPYAVSLEEEHIRDSIDQAKLWAERIEELAEEYEYLSGLSYRLEEVLSEAQEELEYEQYRRQQGWAE